MSYPNFMYTMIQRLDLSYDMYETINVERVWGKLENFFADFTRNKNKSNNINFSNKKTRVSIGHRIKPMRTIEGQKNILCVFIYNTLILKPGIHFGSVIFYPPDPDYLNPPLSFSMTKREIDQQHF